MNNSQRERFSSPTISKNLSYRNESFRSSFVHEQEDKIYTELKMDANIKDGNDDLNSDLYSWTRGGGSGDFGVGVASDTIEEDIGFQDDNVSHVGSEYSDFLPADQDNSFEQQNLFDVYGEQFNEPDIKYNTTEFILKPPSTMHFNYNLPAMPSLPYTAQTRINRYRNSTSTIDKCSHESSPSDMSSSSTSAVASQFPTNSHSNLPCFHPNMWHPNAYRSFGSHTNGPHYDRLLTKDHMEDIFQLSHSSREARNRAEKNRRDRLNGSIQELSKLVPHVAESPRRVDKTAVLRFAAHGLRLRYVFGKSQSNESVQATDSLMKLLQSFFLTMACNGQIVLVSSSIEEHLGHCQTDLYGQNILHITHPEDHQMLKEKLIPTDVEKLFDVQSADEEGEHKKRTQAEEDEIDRKLREDKRSFTIRLARAGPKSETTVYELVKIDGSFRRSDMAPRGQKSSTSPSTLHLMRRSRGRADTICLHSISGNDIVLVAIARIVRPPAISRFVDFNRLEYKTRHLIDGRIIDCDQRISIVAGYMTDEVRNLSPFTFIHQDDVRWVIVALRQMYDCHSCYGESTYRLFSGNGNIIYLHTKGFLEIDKHTNQVHSFMCINTLLDEEEGKRRIASMKNKFSVIINTQIPQSSGDMPASENPQQLEKAVLCLIQNLKSASDDDGESESFSSTSSHTPKCHQEVQSLQHYGSSPTEMACSSKTPPLALVPPATDSVKNSITKSVSVVKTTAVKHLRSSTNTQQQIETYTNCQTDFLANQKSENIFCSPNKESDGYLTPPETDFSKHHNGSRALKRKIAHTLTKTDDDEYVVPMQRQAIENVLSNSLQQINNRLNQQLNAAMEIRDRAQRYEVPNSEEQIADIMKEHQMQQEMYKDITDELQVQCKNNVDGTIDNQTLQECPRTDLVEIRQYNNEGQSYYQRQESLLSLPAATNAASVAHEPQLKADNQL